jgi:hypothetical protein
MAGKTTTPVKKAVARKPEAAPKKTTTKAVSTKAASAKRTSKGENFVCGTCGLSLIVDEWGDVYGEELICCGKAMKQRAAKTQKAKASAR